MPLHNNCLQLALLVQEKPIIHSSSMGEDRANNFCMQRLSSIYFYFARVKISAFELLII